MIKSDVLILGIESSCDDTSVAVVVNGRKVLSNVISSQIDIHKKFGGVVPEIASRKHIENISTVADISLQKAGVKLNDIDAVATTYGPGLVGALLVGLSYGKGLAFSLNKPLIGVHHIEGHICANYIESDFEPPFICLVVSGGHTNLILVKDYTRYEVLGKTRDDAVGEAFDKVARTLGLGYPGGAKIDALYKDEFVTIPFPRAFLEENSLDFSFSGLKSSVLNYINNTKYIDTAVVASSFQKAVVDVLIKKTMDCCAREGISKVAMAGGVSCNSFLRNMMKLSCEEKGYILNMPESIYCTDNAAMIASSAYYNFIKGKISPLNLNAQPMLRLSE